MKTIRLLLLTFLTLGTVFLSSCTPSHRSNTIAVNKEMSNVAFDKVNIGSFFTVHFTQSDTYKVKINISQHFEPYLVSEIRDGKLIVYIDHTDMPIGDMNPMDTAEIEISSPSFEKIELRGASTMILDGKWKLDDVALILRGAAKLRGEEIEVRKLSITQYGASSVKANIFADKLEIEGSGASKLTLNSIQQQAGSKVSVDLSGASRVDLEKLPFAHVEVDASGAAKAMVYPLTRLDAEVSGAARMQYKSSSKGLQKDIDKSGAATVRAI